VRRIPPKGALRIAGDRWLLVGGTRVIDSRTGEVAVQASGAVRQATLLRNGTLAAGRRTVYWTAQGVPHARRTPGR
jgi:hypothetical protein